MSLMSSLQMTMGKLPTVTCRYPSPAGTITKIQEDKIDRTQSPIAIAAAIQQPDLRRSYDYHREGIAEPDGEHGLRSPTNIDTAEAVSHLSTDARNPQPK